MDMIGRSCPVVVSSRHIIVVNQLADSLISRFSGNMSPALCRTPDQLNPWPQSSDNHSM